MNKPIDHKVEFALPMPQAVDADAAGEIEKESVFVSPHLERIRVAGDGKSATLLLRSPEHLEQVKDKAKRFLRLMTKQVGGFAIKTYVETERRDRGGYTPDVNAELARRGWLHLYGQGQVAYSDTVLRLARLIDHTAKSLYAEAFGARECHLPGLVSADLLHKCGYLDSHPNAVSFVGNVIEDFDAIEEFRRANSCAQGALLPPDEHIRMGGMCLNPAACFPCYPMLAGRKFVVGEAYTWHTRVFRYESRNIVGLDRLYEFDVRELVFVGSDDYVRDCRQKALRAVEKLARFFDLDCRVRTATDPFFATVSAAKKFWQQAQEVKNEILLPVLKPDGSRKDLACGSVNLHGNFFGSRFAIHDAAGAPAQTGCVGLGIERWVLAAFTQHGFEPRRWPKPVRSAIF